MSSKSMAGGRVLQEHRASKFFSSNPSPESEVFSDVQVFTKWLVFSHLYATLGSRFRDLWVSVNVLIFHPSHSYCLKELWSQPFPSTAGCKWDEEGTQWRAAPGQRPSLHSEASGFAKRDFSWKQSWSRKTYWTRFCSYCVCTPAFFWKTDLDLGHRGLFCLFAASSHWKSNTIFQQSLEHRRISEEGRKWPSHM